MDKSNLKQLAHLNKEIELLQKEINEIDIVRDTVMGAMGKKGPCIVIEGYDIKRYERIMRRLKRKVEQCLDMREELGEYIDSVDDSLTRTLLRLRFINNLTWAQIAAEMGGGYSETQLRKIMSRFFQQN